MAVVLVVDSLGVVGGFAIAGLLIEQLGVLVAS
jgi:hypothetical protein